MSDKNLAELLMEIVFIWVSKIMLMQPEHNQHSNVERVGVLQR